MLKMTSGARTPTYIHMRTHARTWTRAHLSSHSRIHSFIHTFIQSFAHSLIQSLTHSLTHSSIHSYVNGRKDGIHGQIKAILQRYTYAINPVFDLMVLVEFHLCSSVILQLRPRPPLLTDCLCLWNDIDGLGPSFSLTPPPPTFLHLPILLHPPLHLLLISSPPPLPLPLPRPHVCIIISNWIYFLWALIVWSCC